MRLRKRTWAPSWEADPEPRLTLTALRATRKEHRKVAAEESARMIEGGAQLGRMRKRRDPDDMFTVALLETEHVRWRGMRSLKTMRYQVLKAFNLLRDIGCTSPKSVTRDDLALLCHMSLTQGCAHGTVAFRLSCLSAIGVKIPEDFHFKVPTPPKWFLRPEDEVRVPLCPDLHPMALLFVQWTCATGLRVEESLRVQAKHISSALIRVDGQHREVYILNVPGTKTAGAQATIVLSDEAVTIIGCWGWPKVHPETLLFPIAYKELRLEWQKVRAFLGFQATPTATLKALRRSFARRATLKGMPTDVLRVYLRHKDIQTTQGYLNLVGGYSHEEQARFI